MTSQDYVIILLPVPFSQKGFYFRPRPHWGSLQRSPKPPSWIKGAYFQGKGREGKGRGGEGRGPTSKGKEGEEREGREKEGKRERERGKGGRGWPDQSQTRCYESVIVVQSHSLITNTVIPPFVIY